MLFALADYRNYRAERGVYSAKAIEAEGGRLADETLLSTIHALSAGDLFLYHGRDSKLSWAIMYFTDSIWSHVGTCIGMGNVVDATTGGVVEHSLSDYLDGRGYLDFRVVSGLTDSQRSDVVRLARSTVGAGYNWVGVFRLFAAINAGFHADFRWRFAVDIYMIFGLIALFGLLWRPVYIATMSAAVIYATLLLVSWPSRVSMRRQFEGDSATKP